MRRREWNRLWRESPPSREPAVESPDRAASSATQSPVDAKGPTAHVKEKARATRKAAHEKVRAATIKARKAPARPVAHAVIANGDGRGLPVGGTPVQERSGAQGKGGVRSWLWRYAKPQWKGLTVVLTTMAGTVVFQLLKPWPMKFLVDDILPAEPNEQLTGWLEFLPGAPTRGVVLLWIVAATVLIFLALTLSTMGNTLATVGVGQRMTFDLGATLFAHLQKMSLVFHARRPVGDSISRVTVDPYCLHTMLSGALLPILQASVTVVAMFWVMWRLDPTLTVLTLVVVPFLGVTITAFKGPMKQRSRVKRDLEGNLMSVVQQTLSAVPVVQAFNRQDSENERFRTYADRTIDAMLRSTTTEMWFKLVAGLITVTGTAGMMWLGAHAVFEGRVSLGTILVFLAYLQSLYGPLDQITYSVSSMQYANAQAERIMEIMDQTPKVQDAPDAKDIVIRGHISYRNVTFSYEAGSPVLRDISLEAEPGDVVAIVGPTGAGKSTLVNLLVRFFDPDEGSVSVDGHDLREVRIRSLREQIAIVLQEPFIFPMTVSENIAYGRPGASKEEIVKAAQDANAHDFIQRLPNGYDTLIGERGATLSGGEKQRLSIARAFLKDAPILILDEPTSALDARTESLLLDALRRLMTDRLTFVIAHRLSTIRDADQILVVDHGEIVERGSHTDLMVEEGLYSTLYRHQMDVTHHAVDLRDKAATAVVTE